VFPSLTFYSSWHTFENSNFFLCMDYFISLNMFKFKTTQNIPSSRLVFIRGIFSPQSPHGCEILVLYKFTETCCFHYQDRRVRCVEINICMVEETPVVLHSFAQNVASFRRHYSGSHDKTDYHFVFAIRMASTTK